MKMKQLFLTVFAATIALTSWAQPDNDSIKVIEGIQPPRTYVIPKPYINLPSIETYVLIGTSIQEKRLNGNYGRDVQVITKKDIQSLPVRSVNELLSYVSGLDIRERGPFGAQADLSMMGAGFEQCLILINGVPMRDPQTGHHMLNLPVDLSQIERIEVMNGTAGRIYGSNALAGAINIITSLPKACTSFVETFNATASSQEGFVANGIQAMAAFGKNRSQHSVSMGQFKTNGYRYNSANDQQRISYLGHYQLKRNNTLDIMAGHFKNSFGANGYYAYPYDKDAVEEVNTSFVSAKANIVDAKNIWTFKPIVYARFNQDHYVFIKDNPSYYENTHNSKAAGVELHATRANKFGQLGLGAEGRTEIIQSTNLGDHSRSFFNIYGEERFMLGKFNTTLGVNAQYNTANGVSFFPGIETIRHFTNKSAIFANIGTGNRLPSYTELYYSDRSNTGNDSLLGEKARNVEVGFKKFGKLNFTASGFYRSVYNAINYTRENDLDKWTPSNFTTVNFLGVNANLHWQVCDNASLKLNYTYLDAQLGTENDVQSKYALYHARHRVTFQYRQNITKTLSTNLTVRYTERFTGTNYTVFDFRGMWKLNENITMNFDVTNLLDRKYIDQGYIEMPGRWFRVGFRFNIN
jgi:iron complex outermembrane receptor protein